MRLLQLLITGVEYTKTTSFIFNNSWSVTVMLCKHKICFLKKGGYLAVKKNYINKNRL